MKKETKTSSKAPPSVVIGSRLPRFVAEVRRTPPALSEVALFGLQISDFYTLLN